MGREPKKAVAGDSFGGDKANFTFFWLYFRLSNEFVMLCLIMIANSTSVDLFYQGHQVY